MVSQAKGALQENLLRSIKGSSEENKQRLLARIMKPGYLSWHCTAGEELNQPWWAALHSSPWFG